MKNLKKIARKDLKKVKGGAQGCYYLANGTLYCPCASGFRRCPDGTCVPNNQLCP